MAPEEHGYGRGKKMSGKKKKYDGGYINTDLGIASKKNKKGLTMPKAIKSKDGGGTKLW
jgi:hypothetical protein